MIRNSYSVRKLTVNGTVYTMFVSGADGANFIEYNPDTMFINGGKIYVKITGSGGEIKDILDAPANQGDTLDAFGHLVYYNGEWYLQVSR
jgi:hypothetical protein